MLAKVLPIVLRELMWLLGALLLAAFFAVGLSLLLEQNPALHEPLLRELPTEALFSLKLLLFGLGVLGVYVSRVARAAIASLVAG